MAVAVARAGRRVRVRCSPPPRLGRIEKGGIVVGARGGGIVGVRGVVRRGLRREVRQRPDGG